MLSAVAQRVPRSAASATAVAVSGIILTGLLRNDSNQNEQQEKVSQSQSSSWKDSHLHSAKQESSDTSTDDGTHMENAFSLPSMSATLLSDSINLSRSCSCEGTGTGFRRRQTIRWLDRTSTTASLESRYKVDWDQPLGEGGYGAVYMCTDRKTGERRALKKIPMRFTDQVSFQREIDALLRVREHGSHPNICRLKENFAERGSYYLVLDLISGGELFDHLAKNGPYSEADAARLVMETASALSFLHGVGLVHADLKPENLMLSTPNKTDSVIKLVDFGCSEIYQDVDSKASRKVRKMACNTLAYSPPEVLEKWKGPLLPSFDMWSLGIIVYVMLTGIHPFDLDGTASDKDIEKKLRAYKKPPLRNSPITAHLSPSAIDVIERLMAWNPRRRMTAIQMLEHPWVLGETARTDKIANSDKKLSLYLRYKTKIEAKVFSDWISNSSSDAAKKTSLIERAFHAFDTQQKGFVTTSDLSLEHDDGTPKTGDGKGKVAPLSLSGFSELLSDHMQNKYYPRNHKVYKEGAKGDAIYFINSGTVEVSTKAGFKTTLSQGELFGEGALLDTQGRRSATIRCVTPVHVIRISKEYFEKYMSSGDSNLNLTLREQDRARHRDRATNLLRLQKNLVSAEFLEGDVLFNYGDNDSENLYIVDDGKIDLNTEDGAKILSIYPGDVCGLHSVITGKSRNTTAVCASSKCKVYEMKAKDFKVLYDSSPQMKKSFKEICFRRDFQKALVTKSGRTFNDKDLRKAFEEADLDGCGHIHHDDLKKLLQNLDPTLQDDDPIIEEVLQSMDINGSHSITWDEFQKIFSSSAES